jgi:drug/metabolite transporter (DMT)-like permease
VRPRVGTSGQDAEGWPVHVALLSAQTGFALFPILGKLALVTIPAFVLAPVRVVSAALLLEAFRRAGGRETLARSDRPAVLVYALLGVSFNQVLFIFGLSLTTAINTTILVATIPVFTLAASVLLGRERMTPNAAYGLVLSGAGALLLLNVHRFDWHGRYSVGNLLILTSSLSYSFYLVLSRPILTRYRVLTIVSRLFLYGSVPIVLVATPTLLRFAPTAVTALSWGSLGGVVALCTVMPYLANSWALARTHASRVAFYVFVQPLIASVLAVLILKESLTARTAAAGLLILCGLGISLFPKRPPSSLPA